jgi:hypothetical protein
MTLIGTLIGKIVERQAKKSDFETLQQKLVNGTEPVALRIARAPDTSKNRSQAAHLIGIERWADHRLQTVFNGPAPRDEYNGYRPSPDLAMPALAEEFRRARSETLALVEKLLPHQDQKVAHNEFGEISIKCWLVYLQTHAMGESKRIH